MFLRFASLATQARSIPLSRRAYLLMPLVALMGIFFLFGLTQPAYAGPIVLVPSSNALTSSPNPSLYGETFIITSTVTPITATGEMVYYVNGTYYSTNTLGANATLTSSASLLPPGVYTITAYYSGTNQIEPSTSSVYTHTVLKLGTTTEVTSNPNPSEINSDIIFTATVTPDALLGPQGEIGVQFSNPFAGDVEFYDDGMLMGSAPIDESGVATYTTGMPVGVHPITAVYVGNSFFISSTTAVYTQTVVKHPTESALEVVPTSVTVNDEVAFTATVTSDFSLDSISIQDVSGPTGSVTFYINGDFAGIGTIEANGVATYTTTIYMPAGTYTVTAEYNGGKYYATSISNEVLLVVNKIDTTIEVASDTNPSEVDFSVLFTATVTPDAYLIGSLGEVGVQGGNPFAGDVEFYDGATLLGSNPIDNEGVATFTTSDLDVGDRSITARYVGNEYFAASTTSVLTQTVTQHPTESVLEIAPSSVTFADPVTFTTTVSSNYLAGSFGVQYPVNPLQGVVTLYQGANPGYLPMAVDANGVATYTTYAIAPAGLYTFTAVYSGNEKFKPSTSNEASVLVNQAATTTTVESALNPATFGQNITFTATVSSDVLLFIGSQALDGIAETQSPSYYYGNVIFKEGANELGTATVDSEGVATFTTANLPVGTYSITAEYEGNAYFLGSTSSAINQVVDPAPTETALVITPNPVTFGGQLSISATVSSDYLLTAIGAQEAINPFEGNVTWYINGQASNVYPVNEHGVALEYGYAFTPAGSYSITAVYGGNANLAPSTSNEVLLTVNKAPTTVSVESSPNPSDYGKRVTFTATVGGNIVLTSVGLPNDSLSTQGGGGFFTGDVTFKDGETVIGTASIDESGVATLTTNSLLPGSHAITVEYAGNPYFAGSTSSPVNQVVNKLPTTVGVTSNLNPALQGDNVTFSASVEGTVHFESAGIEIAAPINQLSGNVTFKDGATTLGTATLNGDGLATFSTSALTVGTHNITAVYEGNTLFEDSTSGNLAQVVNGEPVAPLAVNDAAGTLEGVAVSVAVLDNDVNHSNGALSIQSVAQPSHGSAAINGNNVVYTPTAGFNGLDSFTYTVVDGNSLTNVGNVAIIVSAQSTSGQAPQVAILNNATGGQVNYKGDDADLDLTVLSGIYTGTLSEKDVFYLVLTWLITPSEGDSGNLQFANLSFDLSAYLNGSKLEHFVFGEPVTLTISYAETLLGGLSPESLQLLFLDGNTWNNSGIELVGHDMDNRTFEVRISHLSEFALFAQSPTNLPNGPQPTNRVQLFMPNIGN